MEKIFENLERSERTFQTASHLLYITFPLVREQRLLLKILLEIKESIKDAISSILQYEYLYKRIKLYQNPKTNFNTFLEKCAPKYGISKSICKEIKELFEIAKKHKESPFEFVKGEKVVIFSENSNHKTINLEKVKKFGEVNKEILEKAKQIILR